MGKTGIGSFNPIRIQSMLTSESTDPEEVMREIRALNDCGCELVRITIPNGKALDTAKEIRRRMESEGIALPLIADIHFNPRLAVDACELFEKVRINPGNYADRKKFKVREYSDSQYNDELERVEEKLLPLIKNLKFHQRALRVGTNHGSLSDRVMNRYGDTPEGMVQSAMEYLRILGKHQFHDIILSMKSSNPLVMKEAYRLLVHRMESEQMDYPLHLGVTEAGNGLDGRIKSAVGIGGLLNEGLGDTIRVSLTEPSENEIPAARVILRGLERFEGGTHHTGFPVPKIIPAYTLSTVVEIEGCRIGPKETFKLFALGQKEKKPEPPDEFDAWIHADSVTSQVVFIDDKGIDSDSLNSLLPKGKDLLLLLKAVNPLISFQELSKFLHENGISGSIGYVLPSMDSPENHLGLAAQLGKLITDRNLHCLAIQNPDPDSHETEFARILLQSTRVRLFRTEFISCPSCGRTFFDLQKTTEAIKSRTAHLKGVKIAVMGCIVNGPGEMADADFGYIGSGPGRINLYRGKDCVERNISSMNAVEKLISLIRKEGQWVEPEKESQAT